MSTPAPFRIDIPQTILDRIRTRLDDYPWRAVRSTGDADAQFGLPLSTVRALAAHWRERYDWRAHERVINAAPHFRVDLDGQLLHFVHLRAEAGDGLPILLIHGWPNSAVSFLEFAGRLTGPGPGGEPGHDVVIVSLPGFGFSGPPVGPMGPAAMATLLDRLMIGVLGYHRYLPHGGDFGGFVASRLGFDHAAHVAGVHSTSFMVRHDGAALGSGQTGADDASEAERAFVGQEAAGFVQEGGYAMIQGSRPLLLDYAMEDSPLGTAAWIVEKFARWSDAQGREVLEVFDPETLLTEVMVTLVSGSFGTSTWIYPGYLMEGSATLPTGERIEVPTAFAAFPDPVFPPPPRAFMERSHNVVRWTDMPRGGHFPFYEAPDDLAADLRAFAATLG